MSKCEICGRELGLNEDHRDCVIRDYAKCIKDLEQLQNQKAIECLKDIKRNFYAFDGIELLGYIDTKIKELEGEE